MDHHIKVLLQKYVRQECTAEELEEVITFFQQDADSNVEQLPSFEEVLELIGEKQQMRDASAKRIYRDIMAISGNSNHRKFGLSKKYFHRIAIAAVFAGIICGGLFLQNMRNQETEKFSEPSQDFVILQTENGQQTILEDNDSSQVRDLRGNIIGFQKGSTIVYAPKNEITSPRYNTIRVPHGERFELGLSDGTRVFLNAGTSFKFPEGFVKGKSREVFLTGEAYFQVSKDTVHPFIVQTGDLSIEVLGTAFNVSAYEQDADQSVVLVEGKVKVNNDGQQNMVMSPNQKVTLAAGILKASEIEASDFTSWKDGYLTLKEASVKETISALERYYHIEIKSKEQQHLENIVGSGKIYLSDQVENVIKTLSLLTNNNYSFEWKE